MSDTGGFSLSQTRRAFRSIDTSGDGKLSRQEVRTALQKAGLPAGDHDINRLMTTTNSKVGQAPMEIDFDDFRTLCVQHQEWQRVERHVLKPRHHGLMAGQLPPAVETLVSGGIAGAVSRTVVSPFERLKILQQTQGYPPKYVGIIPSLRLIHQEESMKGFFRGNWSNVLRIAPASACQFYFYSFYLNTLFGKKKDDKNISTAQRLVSGGSAGATALLITYPLEFIRGRLSVQTDNRYKNVNHAFKTVVRQEGPLALYKGLWPSLLGVVPYVGIDFAVYYTLRELFFDKLGMQNAGVALVCGGVAGAAAQTVSYPLDVIRRRLQVQDFKKTPDRYDGVVHAFQTIYRKEGVKGLYKGLVANYCKVIPAMGVTFLVFEECKKLFASD